MTPINVVSYGIAPNQPSLAAQNTARLRELLDPMAAGPRGTLIFPNTLGADTYHFDDMIEVRDGIHMDLMKCRVKFTKAAYESGDSTYGFFTFVRDVSIENGEIEVDYDGTGGVNAGSALRIGSRHTYPFASFREGIFDKRDLEDNKLPPQGAITLRNLKIVSNNPAAHPILMLGALRGVTTENLTIDGRGAPGTGILYEFGFASTNDSAAFKDWSSSHASGLSFTNTRVFNLNPRISGGAGLELTGAYDSTVTDLFVDTANTAFIWRPGEALNYRPGPSDAAGSKSGIRLRNIVGMNVVNGIALIGAESSGGGYLAGAGLTAAQQTDLMRFSLDGFAFTGNGSTGTGVFVSGPCDVRNGIAQFFNNNVVISDECVQFDFVNCYFLNAADIGVRGDFGDKVFVTARKKRGRLEVCVIAGSTGPGLTLGNTDSVRVAHCRFGHHADYDGIDENSQTYGIALSDTARGVIADTCFSAIKAGGGGLSYGSQGSSDRGNTIINPQGDKTFAEGLWRLVVA